LLALAASANISPVNANIDNIATLNSTEEVIVNSSETKGMAAEGDIKGNECADNVSLRTTSGSKTNSSKSKESISEQLNGNRKTRRKKFPSYLSNDFYGREWWRNKTGIWMTCLYVYSTKMFKV